MKTYAFIVAYDGSNYYGWQVQPNKISIQQKLQDTFFSLFNEKVLVVAASRTDAGVHAHGQVAIIKTHLNLDPHKISFAWNNALGGDIVIRDMVEVGDDFHPRYNVLQKTYRYYFFLERPSPFLCPYGWFVTSRPDLKKLKQCLQLFVGNHDFRSFCTGDEMGDNTIRMIERIDLEYVEDYKAYVITVKGPGFLRHMIRRIVGAAVTVASRDDLTVSFLQGVLQEKDPRQSLINAPAQGLFLYNITYKT